MPEQAAILEQAVALTDLASSDARKALFAEIEETLKTASERSRARILTGTKRLFLKHADRLDSDAIALFDDLFLHQTGSVDIDALEALSQVLAPLPYAPVKLMQFFANHDSIAIAGPVLTQATCLEPEEIFGIASQCSQQHLLAICQRAAIDEHLAALLIDRGDQKVIDTLAKNPGAKYQIEDFGMMLGRATADERARVLMSMPVEVLNAETGPAYVRCMMVDISPGGAKLQFVNPVPLPETFILEFTNVDKTRITARNIWQKENIAGLFFTSSLCALWGATPVPLPNVRTAADLPVAR